MNITFDVASTDEHFEQIIQLQKQNHSSLISEEQQADQGFVYAQHTVPLLKKMASQLPQVIALSDAKVIGYNLALPRSMKYEIPSLTPMFEQFEKSEYKGKPLPSYKFVIGGQVCVDKDYRGHGLMSRLYQETRNRVLLSGHQLCVTEVAVRNVVSLNAHIKMGFEIVSTYHDGKELWKVVVWDFAKA